MHNMDSSKSPFDSSKFSGSGESASNEPGSATGMFGTVKPQAAHAPEQDDLLKDLLRSETAPAKTAPPETPSPVTPFAPPTAAPAGSGLEGFTQMFQTLKSSEPQPTKVDSSSSAPAETTTPASPSKPPADLTSVFTPVSINKPAPRTDMPAPRAPFAPEPKPGEFTQLLQTLSSPLAKTQAPPSPSPIVEPAKPSEKPETFTEMLKTAPAQPDASEAGFAPVHVPETSPSSVTTQAAPVQTPAADQSAGPGAFTQMFQSLSPTKPVAETAPVSQQAAPVASSTPPQPAAAGGFTQMFQSLSETKATTPAPPQSQPGSTFEPPAPTPKSEPGGFTQMFSQIGAQNSQQEEFFASLKKQPSPSDFPSVAQAPGSSPISNPTPAQGGFTQLFQALGKEDTAPTKEPPPLMPSSSPATAPRP